MLKRIMAAASAGLLLATAACGWSGDGAGQDDQSGKTPLRVSAVPIIDLAPLHMGVERGTFRGEGLEVEITPIRTGSAVIPAVLSGDIQIGYSNVVALMQARAQGLPLKILTNESLAVAPASDRPEGRTAQALVVDSGGTAKKVSDLNGGVVAVNGLKNHNELLVRAAIDEAGGNSSEIEFIELAYSEMMPALQDGEIDAAALNDPYTTTALQQGAEIILRPFTDLEDPASDVAMFFASEQFLSENPETAEHFTDALTQASEYAGEHPDQVRKSLSTYTDIDAAVIEDVILPHYTTELNTNSIEEIAALAEQYGLVEDAPSVEEVVWDANQDD